MPLNQNKKNLLPTILWAGLAVGYLDITFAIINFMFNSDKSPVIIFRYISSAAFGAKRAYSESSMITYGILFHFLIAYIFTIVFFLIYPHIRFLSKSRLLTGILYGLFVWAVMNFAIVPMSGIGRFPVWDYKTLIQALILIAAIGIPLSYIAYRYYRGRGVEQMNR